MPPIRSTGFCHILSIDVRSFPSRASLPRGKGLDFWPMAFGGRGGHAPERVLRDILMGRANPALDHLSARSWKSLVDLAQRHRVHLFLRQACLDRNLAVPPDSLRILDHERGAWLAKRRALGTTLEEIAGIARNAGIDMIVLKGPNLAERLYADPKLRPYRDLDLLIRPEELARVLAALEDSGYEAAPGPYSGVSIDNQISWRLPVALSPPSH